MRIALDINKHRVHINETHAKENYFCPECGEELILKKGEIRQHHFAHRKDSPCVDGWHYDMSNWHLMWQDKFPRDTQEIVKVSDGKKHRADILIEECKTVLEFQHSPLDANEFDERNVFYNNLGYKVIWVFDVAEQYFSGAIEELRVNLYKWRRPKATFNNLDAINNPNIEIYLEFINDSDMNSNIKEYLDGVKETGISDFSFELYEYYQNHKDDEGFMAKLNWVSPDGLERFKTSRAITIRDFVLKFKSYIEVSYEYELEDVYDNLKFLYSKDHTSYYGGCLLSSTGKCCDCLIDVLERDYDKIKPCELCKHSGNKNGPICYKRLHDLNLPKEVKIISIEKDFNDRIKKLIYSYNGIEQSREFTEIKTSPPGDSIINLWNQKNPSVATFKNLNTGFFVRINQNPTDNLNKYRRVYGKFSRNQYSFNGESKEIYNYYKKEWVMVWYK